MKNFKKIFFVFLLLTLFIVANKVFAMTPSVSVSNDPNDSSMVIFSITGDANSSVLLNYYSSNTSGQQIKYFGNTNTSGQFSKEISLSDYNIIQNSNLSVSVNGQQSPQMLWSYSSASTASQVFSFSQSSVVTKVGESITVTTQNNGNNQVYFLNSSNPQVANFSISGNQITVNGLTSGQTTGTFCQITTNSSTNSGCISLYVIVQNAGTQSLSFSRNNTSIISGQNVPITITGGNGFYQIQNNSSSSIISTNLNGPILTLYANGSTGSSTVTVCSTDMNACGIVTASIGNYTTSGTGLSLSTTYPTIITGQTQTITISGGAGNYYISSNSNTNIVQTYLSGNSLSLYGNTPGNSTVIVCSPSGSCGTISAMVVSVSGGALTLNQSSVSLTSGQIMSVLISGGTAPYQIIQHDTGIAQYSLSGSALTITGVSAGSSSVAICSSGGACITLSVTVTGTTGSTISGVQPSFSQNNFSMNTNQTTSVLLSGNGGYYISNNSNNSVVSASISGNNIVVFGITVGSTNITVCQVGGQCNTLYVSVSNSTTNTVISVPLSFDKPSVDIDVGKSSNVNVSGGSGVGYYISYNSNSNVIGVFVSGSVITITGNNAGSGTLSVCSSASVCGSIAVAVNKPIQSTKSEPVETKFKFTKALKFGMSGTEVRELQKKLIEEGVYSGAVTGYYGNLTVTAVKKLQKKNGLSQLGSVGPGTRALLNK